MIKTIGIHTFSKSTETLPVKAVRGGGQTCGHQRQAEGGRYPWTGYPLGMTGTWAQVEGGKGVSTRQGTAVTVSREELLVVDQQGMEVQTSGGCLRVGGPSRWVI